MSSCACGSSKPFSECCEPFIEGKRLPETAEQLMRSRYTAYTVGNIDYIRDTLAPESRHDFDYKATKQWSQQAKWKSLRIVSSKKGGTDDRDGTVEFIATYLHGKDGIEHHEVAEFRRDDKDQWFFVDGDSHTHREGEGHHHHPPVKRETVVRDAPKVGRNDPCVCGSGKKYKKCCGASAAEA